MFLVLLLEKREARSLVWMRENVKRAGALFCEKASPGRCTLAATCVATHVDVTRICNEQNANAIIYHPLLVAACDRYESSASVIFKPQLRNQQQQHRNYICTQVQLLRTPWHGTWMALLFFAWYSNCKKWNLLRAAPCVHVTIYQETTAEPKKILKWKFNCIWNIEK